MIINKLQIFKLLQWGLLFVPSMAIAQGGGPPMLTTDPGTPGKNHWEINTSLNCHYTGKAEVQIPATEVVYGIANHCQISVQLPMPDVELNSSLVTTLSQPQLGVKYELLTEEQNYLSFSVYPQVIVPLRGEQSAQFFIPLEFEKSFNNFCIGEEIGLFILSPEMIFNGTVVGFRFPNDLEFMGEFYCSKTLKESRTTTGMLNFGFRKQLSNHLVIMSSMGTEIITPPDEEKESLFGLIGVQILLGS